MIYSLKEVSKHYTTSKETVRAVSELTFDIGPGERVALIGPSGSGKTTLFRVLNATLRPTGGVLKFNERNVSEMSGRELRAMRRQVGTVYQQHFLVPSLSALDNALCGRLGHWSLLRTIRSLVRPTRSDSEQAMAALESVGLADKRNARADELSGGQQQRLAIARVLMQEPDVILADEPFASLDPALTETIISLLIGITLNGNSALVVTLHDVEMALRLFPRLIALRNGRLVFDASPAEITRADIDALYDEAKQLNEPDSMESFCETGSPH